MSLAISIVALALSAASLGLTLDLILQKFLKKERQIVSTEELSRQQRDTRQQEMYNRNFQNYDGFEDSQKE